MIVKKVVCSNASESVHNATCSVTATNRTRSSVSIDVYLADDVLIDNVHVSKITFSHFSSISFLSSTHRKISTLMFGIPVIYRFGIRSQACGKLDISIFEYARCIIKFTHRHRAHRHSIDSIVFVSRFFSFFCISFVQVKMSWFYRISNDIPFKSFLGLSNVTVDLCQYLEHGSGIMMVDMFVDEFKKSSNLFHPCPFKVCVCVSKSIIFSVSFEFKTDSIAGSLLRKRFQSEYITLAANNAKRSLQRSTHILYEEIGDRRYSIRCENLFGCQDNSMKWRANKNPWNEQNQSDEFYSVRDMARCICILRLFV